MSSDLLASIWSLLQARIDILSIVHEILGQFTLGSQSVVSSQTAFSLLVWLKLIYDIQRSYSQSSNPSQDTLSFLLPPKILLDTISLVLQIRPGRLRTPSALSDKSLAQRCFAARVLLSGLRALQLRQKIGNDSSLSELKDTVTLIDTWWHEAEGVPTERFILRRCLEAWSQVQRGPQVGSTWNLPAENTCQLRDYENGFYDPAIFDSTRTVFLAQLEQFQGDQETHFWPLFDILWAAEAGYIKWSADQLLGKAVVPYESELDDLATSVRVIAPDHCSTTILLQNWNQDLTNSESRVSLIETSLEYLRVFLTSRQESLVDFKLDLRHLDSDLQAIIESWIRNTSAHSEGEDVWGSIGLPSDRIYVMNCSQLHVISEVELREQFSANKHNMFENPTLLSFEGFEIQCPRCPRDVHLPRVSHARMIEPLQYMSMRLNRLVSGDTTVDLGEKPNSVAPEDPNGSMSGTQKSEGARLLNQENLPELKAAQTPRPTLQNAELTPTITPQSPPPGVTLNKSSLESEIPSATSIEKVHTLGKVKSWVMSKMSPNKGSKSAKVLMPSYPVPDLQNHAFSVDGKTLLLWSTTQLVCSTVPLSDGPESDSDWNWKYFNVPNILYVAGGGENVAIVSKEGNEYKMKAFNSVNTIPSVATIDLTIPHQGSIWSIAISMLGKYVAIGSDTQALVYNTDDKSLQNPIDLSSRDDVSSQRMCFSPDEKKLAIATRKLNGQTDLMLWDHLELVEVWPVHRTGEGERTDQDHGLSGLFFDARLHCIVRTAYSNKLYHLMHTEKGEALEWKASTGKIQAAAYCSTGSKYRLLAGNGDVFELDLEQQQVPSKPLFSLKEFVRWPGSAKGFAALWMPRSDRMYVFWRDGENVKFGVVDGNDGLVPKHFRCP
ncbi:hypothetical protein BKA64DRAFT_263277 [Cadophora sp. MPI-SDFR-AT-0126]|nr:hypothetical protein BKA64DRAFT_263277 [Leotiomycetes sp. MPI-SDFR-AT-0126]